jgi:hypothetical protein
MVIASSTLGDLLAEPLSKACMPCSSIHSDAPAAAGCATPQSSIQWALRSLSISGPGGHPPARRAYDKNANAHAPKRMLLDSRQHGLQLIHVVTVSNLGCIGDGSRSRCLRRSFRKDRSRGRSCWWCCFRHGRNRGHRRRLRSGFGRWRQRCRGIYRRRGNPLDWRWRCWRRGSRRDRDSRHVRGNSG